MMQHMMQHMCWLPRFGGNGEKILHLRISSQEGWRPYTSFPQYARPDHRVPKGSKGWATYQHLLKQGWTLLPSNTQNHPVLESNWAESYQRPAV